MEQGRYISQAERARRLLDKAVSAWQRLQTFAMEHDELVDSIVLRGQELWLPHHETDGREFRVTLVVSLHYPQSVGGVDPRTAVADYVQQLERDFSNGDGTLTMRLESSA